jgi:predicted nucleic acid-binding protein
VRFVDTNILLYAISQDPEERAKAALANELLSSRDVGVSVQVLQEFYVQATRDSRSDRLTHEQAEALVESFRRFPVQETRSAWCLPPCQRGSDSGSHIGTPRYSRPHVL